LATSFSRPLVPKVMALKGDLDYWTTTTTIAPNSPLPSPMIKRVVVRKCQCVDHVISQTTEIVSVTSSELGGTIGVGAGVASAPATSACSYTGAR
jgi:hypothetical protein